jgi:hypothetical protein
VEIPYSILIVLGCKEEHLISPQDWNLLPKSMSQNIFESVFYKCLRTFFTKLSRNVPSDHLIG